MRIRKYFFIIFCSFFLTSALSSQIFASNINNSSSHPLYYDLENKNLKIAATSGKISINGNSGWLAFKNAGNCTGNGTYSEPYVIENLIIDGGDSGSCILIENSDVYFKIENCTLFNSGGYWLYAGIELDTTTNGQLIKNTCSSNSNGIYLIYCDNNTISENLIHNNGEGIFLRKCNNISVIGNTANNGRGPGIYLNNCNNNIISGNTANHNTWGDGINLFECNNATVSGNTASFNDYNGICLSDCNNATVSGNIASFNYYNGLLLWDFNNNNNISGNTANYNTESGIYLGFFCNYNNISGNTANYNTEGGIHLGSFCNYNTISVNNASYNGYGIYLNHNYYNSISENVMNGCGLQISGDIETLASYDIEPTNLVNGKLLYYYTNEEVLGSNNFTNAGEVILVNCSDSLISNLDTSYTTSGISLYYCINNNISENTANNNTLDGIYLYYSDYNYVSGNIATNNQNGIYLKESDYNIVSGNNFFGNDKCIVEDNCQGNEFSDNGECAYGQDEDDGNPFELTIIYSVISGGGVIGVATLLLILRKRKRE